MRAALIAAALVAAFSLAQAAELGRTRDEAGQLVVLHDGGGPCPQGLLWVELVSAGGKKTFDGCAIERDGTVFVVWSDGDRDRIPRRAFRPGT